MTLTAPAAVEVRDVERRVSILVFLDDAHRQHAMGSLDDLDLDVSILVFLDDAHRQIVTVFSPLGHEGFNPCFLG